MSKVFFFEILGKTEREREREREMEDPLVEEKKERAKFRSRVIWAFGVRTLQTKIRMRACSSCCFCCFEEEEGVPVDVCECSSMFCVIPMCCAYTKPISCVGCFYRSGSRRNKFPSNSVT